ESGSADDDALEELIDRIEFMLRSGGPSQVDTAELIREGLEATLRAWSRTLVIETEVDDAAVDWLARNPGSMAIAHDAVIEGLTSAVRYGPSPHAIVRVRHVDDSIELVICSPGAVAALDDDGLALRDLDERAESAE